MIQYKKTEHNWNKQQELEFSGKGNGTQTIKLYNKNTKQFAGEGKLGVQELNNENTGSLAVKH